MKPVPPTLADLLGRYLDRLARNPDLAAGDAEVVPHGVAAAPVELAQSWRDAVAVLEAFVPGAAREQRTAPPAWSALAGSVPAVVALPMSLGHFPQMVHDLAGLQEGRLRPRPIRAETPASERAEVVRWAEETVHGGGPAARLLACGLLRVAGEEECAAEILPAGRDLSAAWRPCQDNEAAALDWQAGRLEAATARWQSLPALAPVRFNLGLAALVRGDKAAAGQAFEEALGGLPETGGWHHLAQVYLALARM